MEETVETFYQISTYSGYHNECFHHPLLHVNVVNVVTLSKQSWVNYKLQDTTLSRGEENKYSLPALS